MMRRAKNWGCAVVVLMFGAASVGCNSGDGDGNQIRDASSVEARDDDGGSSLPDSGRDDRDGGIVIPEDAGTTNPCDPRTEFSCGDGRCIIRARQCDQIVDCADQSDEAKCPTRCGLGDFVCNSGACVSARARCDGVRQCADQSDELGCGTPCAGFRCGDSVCIPTNYRCDQIFDCADNSDEEACTTECNVTPPPVSGWDGIPTLTAAQLTQCQTFCGDDDSCYTDANCPGITAFNDCANAELLACSVNVGGACRSEYQALTCCADERCGNDQVCVEANCDVELQSIRDCIVDDSTCLNESANRCLAAG